MTTTATPPQPVTDGFTRHRDHVRAAIIDQHTRGKSLDVGSLVAAAIEARRAVQHHEARVNFGDEVTQGERDELTMLQTRDIAHRDVLSLVVPGWGRALSWARTGWPRSNRADNMERAARELGVTP